MVKAGTKLVEHFTVSTEVYRGFIAAFGDRHKLHTDAEYARRRGFKAAVMHGNILCGFLSNFIGERFPEKDVMILSQEIKFLSPVYLGDQLTLEADITGVHESVGVIEIGCKFRNAGGKTVATARIDVGRIGGREDAKSPTS